MFTVWGFLVGIFAVWLYAAIRPRYGAGAKTLSLGDGLMSQNVSGFPVLLRRFLSQHCGSIAQIF